MVENIGNQKAALLASYCQSTDLMKKIPLHLWRWALGLCVVSDLVLALIPNPPEIPSTDGIKTNHLLAFAVIMILGCYAFHPKKWRVILGAMAFGILIEALQLLTSYRNGQWIDVLVDLVGVLIGLIVVLIIDRVVPKSSPLPSR